MPASYFLEDYIMKKIAILRCLKTSASCAGAGCLRAFYEKNKFGIDGERKFYYGGKNPEDAILMSRMV